MCKDYRGRHIDCIDVVRHTLLSSSDIDHRLEECVDASSLWLKMGFETYQAVPTWMCCSEEPSAQWGMFSHGSSNMPIALMGFFFRLAAGDG
jgi:hypothetical protein